jgi:hypothetical protein
MRVGISNESEWLGFLDADGSIPPHEVLHASQFLEWRRRLTHCLLPGAKFSAAQFTGPGSGTLGDASLRH